MINELSGGKKVVGLKQAQKAVKLGTARAAFVAEDADARLKNSFISLCNEREVPVFIVKTMLELGRACRIDIGAGFAALLK